MCAWCRERERFTCEAVHPTSPRVFATLRYLEGAGSRFRLHVGRSARERGQARTREARVDPTERAVSDQEIVDDPHQRIADLLETFDINLVAVIA